MTTSIASGLGATFGYASESSWNTFAAPTRWVTMTKEQLKMKKNIVQGKALHGGLYDLASRRAYVTHTVDGSIDMDLYDRAQGLLWEQALGSTPVVTQLGSTAAWQQVHTPGDTVGKSLSIQVGRPTTGGTVQPFSWSGAKVTDWTLNVASGQQGTLTISVDAATESTSQTYGAASYPVSNMLHFAEATLVTGAPGPASTTIAAGSNGQSLPQTTITVASTTGFLPSGAITVVTGAGSQTVTYTGLTGTTFTGCTGGTGSMSTGGAVTSQYTVIGSPTTIANAKSCQIKGTNAMADDRFFLGASGTKAEQLANGFRAITGTVDIEFADLTTVYNAMAADTGVALQLTFTGPTIASGVTSMVQVLVPRLYWDEDAPTVDGPAVLHQSVNFTALDDQTTTPIQVVITSLDTAP